MRLIGAAAGRGMTDSRAEQTGRIAHLREGNVRPSVRAAAAVVRRVVGGRRAAFWLAAEGPAIRQHFVGRTVVIDEGGRVKVGAGSQAARRHGGRRQLGRRNRRRIVFDDGWGRRRQRRRGHSSADDELTAAELTAALAAAVMTTGWCKSSGYL